MQTISECPLCGSQKYIIDRLIPLDKVKAFWDKTFSYDILEKYQLQNVTTLNLYRCSRCDLQFYSPAFFGDSQFYKMLSAEPWYYEENKWEYDCAVENMSGDIKSVLEIGSGFGFFLQKISNRFDAYGLELNEDAVQKCKQSGLKIFKTQEEAFSRKYDGICLFQVLEHVDNPSGLLNLAINGLNKNGFLILSIPNPTGFLLEIDFDPLNMPPHHFTCWSKKTFEYIAQNQGLKIITMQNEPLRYVHYMWLLKNIVISNSDSNIIKKIKSLMIKFLAPICYITQKNSIIGHTHLVVFQKITD